MPCLADKIQIPISSYGRNRDIFMLGLNESRMEQIKSNDCLDSATTMLTSKSYGESTNNII